MKLGIAIVHIIILTGLLVFGILDLVEAQGNSFIIPIAYAIAYTIFIPLLLSILAILIYVFGRDDIVRRESEIEMRTRLLDYNNQSNNPVYFNLMWTYFASLGALYVIDVALNWTWVVNYSYYHAPAFYVGVLGIPLLKWVVIRLLCAILNFTVFFIGCKAVCSFLHISYGQITPFATFNENKQATNYLYGVY
jgi:hypothetical protein